MNHPSRLAYLLITSLFISPSLLHSQNKMSIDIEAGTSVLTSRQVKNIYGPGINFLAGPNFRISADDKFNMLFHGGFQWHFKEVEKVNNITDHLRIWKAGAQLQYKVTNGKNPLSVFGNADYNWCANYYSAQTNYNPFTNTSQTVTSDKFLKGTGMSFGGGAMFTFNPIYVKLRFDYFKPDLKVNPVVLKAAADEGVIAPAHYQYNLSSASLTIGYKLKLLK